MKDRTIRRTSTSTRAPITLTGRPGGQRLFTTKVQSSPTTRNKVKVVVWHGL